MNATMRIWPLQSWHSRGSAAKIYSMVRTDEARAPVVHPGGGFVLLFLKIAAYEAPLVRIAEAPSQGMSQARSPADRPATPRFSGRKGIGGRAVPGCARLWPRRRPSEPLLLLSPPDAMVDLPVSITPILRGCFRLARRQSS
jgi:hypothetical protein